MHLLARRKGTATNRLLVHVPGEVLQKVMKVSSLAHHLPDLAMLCDAAIWEMTGVGKPSIEQTRVSLLLQFPASTANHCFQRYLETNHGITTVLYFNNHESVKSRIL
jgi:hypothetical protein